ncbi:MAG: proprotein convertase [Phycisphaerales bacterium]|nr:proprotein convertase [Phycisphaerales bacterium]
MLEVVVNSGILQVRNAAGTVLNSVAYSGVSRIVVNGGGGNDFIRLGRGDGSLAPAIRTILSGDAGNDSIIGGAGPDQLLGGADNDELDGRGGADLLDGGVGFDTANYSNRTVPVRLTLTNSAIANDGSSTGNNSSPAVANDGGGDNLANIEAAIGGTANDVITGNAGANWIDGGGGNDSLFGGAGIDTIVGGVQNDLAYGEGDSDTFLMKDGAADQFLGTPGTTLAQYDTTLDSPAPAAAAALAASSSLKALGGTLAASASDGELTYDTTFGSSHNGMESFTIDGGSLRVSDVALQPDGKIVAVGGISYFSEAPSDFVVMRFTSSGAPDTTFGDAQNGVVLTDFPVSEIDANDFANSVTIDSHNRIVVAGSSSYETFFPNESSATSSDFVIARYTPSGDLDDSFGNNGEVRLDVNQVSSYDSAARIVTQTQRIDGVTIDNYLLAGTVGPYNGPTTSQTPGSVTSSFDTSTSDFAMVRLDESGNQDANFGDGDFEGLSGLVEEDFGGDSNFASEDYLSGLDVDPATGNIWLSGSNEQGFAVIGYNSNGQRLSYGKGVYGFDSSNIPEAHDSAIAGNTLIVVGTLSTEGGSEGAILGVSIEAPTVTFTSALAPGGSVQTILTGPQDDYTMLNGVSIDADGNAVATGGIDGFGYVYRFNPEDLSVVGQPLQYDFGESYDEAHAIVVQPDGKYLVLGGSDSAGTLVRLNSASDVWVDVPLTSGEVQTPGFFTYIDAVTGAVKPVPTYLVWRYTKLTDDGTWTIDGSDLGETYDVYQKNGIVTVTRDGEFWQQTAGTVKKIIINANGGNDVVNVASDFTLPVRVNAGTGNDLVRGGHASDELYGEDGNDILVGGDGNDSIHGGTGRDILIGGADRDSLNGDSGEDVLVAGLTKWDASNINLQKLADEWNRTDLAYAKRVNNLVKGGGKNGSILLNSYTAYSLRSVPDILTGGSDLDGFWGSFKSPGDVLKDRIAAEIVVSST